MRRYRWLVVSVLFFGTTINFADRMILAVLMPVIRREIAITDQAYGYITAAFQIAYGIGNLAIGSAIDRFGTRIGYAVSVGWWSLAAMLHAASRHVFDLALWRGMLGVAEAGNFPAAVKAIAEWFPKKDRALATGVCVAGSNIAAMAGPPVFILLSDRYGWRASFLVTGASGMICLLLWLLVYRRPEPAGGESGRDVPLRWREVVRYRQTWGFALAKSFSDPVWWFYLFWLPLYMFDARGMDLKQIGWALPVIYLVADLGSVAGGWFPGYLMRRGVPPGRARKLAMTVCACLMPIAAMTVLAPGPAAAIALVCVGTAAHQGWSANLFTTVSDVFPTRAVASTIGIGQALASLAGVFFSSLVPGFVISHFGYVPIFLMLGSFHLIGLLWVHLLMGGFERVGGSG